MYKYRLLSEQSNINKVVLITFIFSIVSTWLFITKINTYDSLSVTGIISCDNTCKITLTLPYDKIDVLDKNPILEYNGQKYNIENITYQEPYIVDALIYQDIKFDTNLKNDNTIITFKILSNEQRIIAKIKKIIKGR